MMELVKRPVLMALAIIVVFSAGATAYLSILDRLDRARRLHQARDILVASRLYAVDHGGAMPGSFDDLAKLTNPAGALRYPKSPDGTQQFLERASRELEIVTPGITHGADPATPFLWERRPDRNGLRAVGYVDASALLVEKVPPVPRYLIPLSDPPPRGDFMTPLEMSRLAPH